MAMAHPTEPKHSDVPDSDVGDEEPPVYAEAFPALDSGLTQSQPAAAAGAWYKKVASLGTSNATQVFSIPHTELKFRNPDLGEHSETMRKVRAIMSKTGSQVDLSRSKDQSLHVVVSGKPQVVPDVRRQLLALLQTQANLEVKVPQEHRQHILGKGGQKLRGIEQRTGTRVFLRGSKNPDMVKIVGSKEGIEAARNEIMAISDKQSKLGIERFKIPKEFHPFVHICLAELKEKHGCRIDMAPLTVPNDQITVTGDKVHVVAAAKEIQDLYETKKKTTTTVSIQIEKSQHKFITGPKRQTLLDILKQTGVSVEVPSPDSSESTVTLRGERDKIGSALTVVYEKANSVLASEVKAPAWLHRHAVGRRGNNVTKIMKAFPKVRIELKARKGVIAIEGPAAEAGQAHEQLDKLLKEMISTMASEEVLVPRQFHRHIIGKNGHTIGRLKAGTDVTFIVPPDSSAKEHIRIEGLKDDVAKAKEAVTEFVTTMENERSEDVRVERRFHSLIIGSKGEKIRKLCKACNGVQVLFPSHGVRSDFVQVKGPKADVEKARDMLTKMNEDLIAENYRITVPIFKKFHRNIIGRGGAVIRRLREETHCRIEIPTDEADSDIISLIGRKENVEKAKKLLLAIQQEQCNIVSEEVQIPQKYHNSIIGRGRRLLASIQEECGGVRIQFPSSKQASDTVVVRGSVQDVQKAKDQLLELANERALNSATEEVRAKREYHRFLIGRGGANIRQIRETTGTRIIFANAQDEDPELITIVGRREAVAEAKEKFQELIKNLDDTVEETITVPVKYHRHFVQHRGQVLRTLTEEVGGVSLNFPKSGSDRDKVTVKGGKDCVAEAKRRIQDILDNLEAQVTEDCHIPAQYHRAVLGQRGSNIQAILADYDVAIKFPDRPVGKGADAADSEQLDIIQVTGHRDLVKKACAALKSFVPVSENVRVPLEYHRFIIGRRGEGIQRLRADYSVDVTVPPHNDSSDYMTVTGSRDDVISCMQALQQQVQQLDDEREERRLHAFKVEVEVDPKYHSKLIGKRGEQIARLRRLYDVQFHFPDKKDANGKIVIQGLKASCEAAKDSVLSIIRDLKDQVTKEIEIDPRCHSRLIGKKGKIIQRTMDRFGVEVHFSADKSSPLVEVSGLPDSVEDCCEHLLLLVEEYLQDLEEQAEDKALQRHYTTIPGRSDESRREKSSNSGFVLRNAPWSSSALGDEDQFPSFGGGVLSRSGAVQWGPRRRR